jgi:hypothetical protein
VAGGAYGNQVAYSYDGVTWTVSSSGNAIFTSQCYGVAYNGIIWVACGSGTNQLAYSTDGINWTASTSGNSLLTVNGLGVAWNGNIWVAVGTGASATVIYSYDGINWTNSTSGTAFSNAFAKSVAWNGTIWLVGGYLSGIAYSYDGINWISGANSFGSVVFGLAWNGALWVLCGTSGLFYSSDGFNWSAAASGGTLFNSASSVAWNGTMWVAVGGGYTKSDTIAYSYDGMNWTGVGLTTFSSDGSGIAWNGSLWVAGGGGTNQIATSPDGINWTGSASGNTAFPGGSVCNTVASRRVLPYIGTTIAKNTPLIQYGTGTSDASLFTLAVGFTRRFTGIPTITASVTDGSASWVSIGSASSTGCTAYTWNATGGVQAPLNWQAIL